MPLLFIAPVELPARDISDLLRLLSDREKP